MDPSETPLLASLSALPRGYSEGVFEGRRYNLTVKASEDGRRWWVWGEELGGHDRISGNLYQLADGRVLLKPCEMSADKVETFIRGYESVIADPDRTTGRSVPDTTTS